jgi:hypothetical protein
MNNERERLLLIITEMHEAESAEPCEHAVGVGVGVVLDMSTQWK